MAQITLDTSEPQKIVHLVNGMFPGVNLDIVTKFLDGVTSASITKQTAPHETLTLSLTIVPAPVK